MKPSTHAPQALPEPPALRRLTKALATLDAVLCPEWQYRHHSFNSRWGVGEQMASMRDGSGDEWFLLFAPWGVALKGLAHESPLARVPGFAVRIQQSVPADFASFLHEPAFCMDQATFCLWRGRADTRWSVVSADGGPASADADGSAELLAILDGDPRTYQAWAQDYYERDVPLEAVRALYEHQALDVDLVAALNPELALADLRPDTDEIGYPEAPDA